jgi:glutamate racemase
MIGVFDSGFGGLTVLKAMLERLPAYDYLYLGDSARAPYGARSPEVVYQFTREAVEHLFDAGCPLVILACNTASARALRTIQQRHLPARRPDRRVLGVVRPSAEALAALPPGAIPGVTPASAATGTVAVLGTTGTIASDSYRLELEKLAPGLRLVQQACPLWVPLVEEGELDGPGVDHFLHKYLDPVLAPPRGGEPPARILLGCTHYPLLWPRLRAIVPAEIELITQGEIVAERLADWLVRHPEMERRLGRGGTRRYVTTDDPAWFAERGARLLGRPIHAETVRLPAIAGPP